MTRRSPESSSSETLKQKVLKFGTAASIGLLALTGCGDKTEAVGTSSSQGVEQSQGVEPTSEAYTIPNNTDIRELDMTAEQYDKLEATAENTEVHPEIAKLIEETRVRTIMDLQVDFEPTPLSSEQDELAKKTLDQFLTKFENLLSGENVHYSNGNEEDFWKLAFEAFGDDYAFSAKNAGLSYDEYMATFTEESWDAKQYVSSRYVKDAFVDPIVKNIGWKGADYAIKVDGESDSESFNFAYDIIHRTIEAQLYSEISPDYQADPIKIERLNPDGGAYFLGDYPTFVNEPMLFEASNSNPVKTNMSFEFGPGFSSDTTAPVSIEPKK